MKKIKIDTRQIELLKNQITFVKLTKTGLIHKDSISKIKALVKQATGYLKKDISIEIKDHELNIKIMASGGSIPPER